jgi:hypothetical protein
MTVEELTALELAEALASPPPPSKKCATNPKVNPEMTALAMEVPYPGAEVCLISAACLQSEKSSFS